MMVTRARLLTALSAVSGFGGGALACATPSTPPAPHAAPVAANAVDPSATASSKGATAALEAKLCANAARATASRAEPTGACRVKELPGAATAEHPDLHVFEVTLCGSASRVDGGADQGEDEPVTTGDYGGPPCPMAHYFVKGARGSWREPIALGLGSNPGTGASGIGEYGGEVGPNLFKMGLSDGSTWRYSHGRTVRLEPFVVLDEADTWESTMVASSAEERWSNEAFAGTFKWHLDACRDDDAAPDSKRARAFGSEGPLVPRVAMPASFASSAWRTTSLGACALRVSAANPADATLKVLATGTNDFYVEITDDTWVGPTARWLYDDHLEIWISDVHANYMDTCLTPTAVHNPRQWAVRLADGKVFAAYGKPRPSDLRVEVAAAAGPGLPARLHIVVGPKLEAVTFSYSDGDGERRQKMLSTSALKFGDGTTLGYTKDLARLASCEARNGALTPVPASAR